MMIFQAILSLFIVINGVHSQVRSLDENNWDSILHGEWMLEL